MRSRQQACLAACPPACPPARLPACQMVRLTKPTTCASTCRNQVVERFHVAAPVSVLFDNPTIASLAEWISGQMRGGSVRAAPGMPPAPLHEGEAIFTAIAGISCRFPKSGIAGASRTTGVTSYWELTAGGMDTQSIVPLSKWDAGKNIEQGRGGLDFINARYTSIGTVGMQMHTWLEVS